MDYTAIIVSLISLIGMIWQGTRNTKMIKRNDIKEEMQKTQDKLDIIGKGQEYVLQDRLLFLCDKYLDRGYMSTLEYKLLVNMYHAYHDLGGNDFITDLFSRCKCLPIRDVKD